MVITHEQHEANSQAYSGVDTTEDVAAYLRIFFPAIEDSVVQKILDFYPESDYTSPGLRFADMKQHFDLTAHNLAATHAMNNQTWNALCALGSATHGTDQSYYCKITWLCNKKRGMLTCEQGTRRLLSPPHPAMTPAPQPLLQQLLPLPPLLQTQPHRQMAQLQLDQVAEQVPAHSEKPILTLPLP